MRLLDRIFNRDCFDHEDKASFIWSDYILQFDPGDGKSTVHSNEISRNIHTKKKYYIKMELKSATFKTTQHPYAQHKIATDGFLYVAPSFVGTKIANVKDVISSKAHRYALCRYPLMITPWENPLVQAPLSIIKNVITDVHMEPDYKDGKCVMKYIFHMADNEEEYDMYLALYAGSLHKEAREYLLNQYWMETITLRNHQKG